MTYRPALAALLALLLLAPLPAQARIPQKRDGLWPQTYVDRLPDPAIRFGTLPNGLRYAIRRNTTPPGQMSLRLVIRSGSLVEPAGSEGLAHFLEHMAFRGSTHVPDGEVMRILQRKGLAPGADTNANTSPESTVYQFDFPQGGKDSLDTGLMLFREIAGELSITAAAMGAERGVVLSEERLRDGPGYHAGKALLGFTLQGQLAPDRLPIGTIESVSHATPALIRQYYETHYRPDNAVIVAIGDFDPAIVEAEIKARFADWRAKGPPPPLPALGTPLRRGEQARLFTEPGAPTNTQIGWIRPFDDRADTNERTRDDLNRFVGMLILNQRMGDVARRIDAPFIGAGFSQNNVLKSANVTGLGVTATADRQLTAMRAAVAEQRRAVRFGITQPEFDRALATLNAGLTNTANGASTRPSPQLANRMVRDIIENEVTRSPEQDLADFQAWQRFARLKDVDAAVKAAFTGSGPLLFLSSPQPPAGGEKALIAAFDDANHDKVTAPPATQTIGWPYTGFGTPGQVVNRQEIADLGLTIVTFANGTKLAVKPTSFGKDEIRIDASFGQGRLGLPRERAGAYWMAGSSAFVDGGTGKVTAGEIQRTMAGRVVGAQFQLQDTSFELVGTTRPEDLLVEMQILTAYLSDPGFRPEAVTRIQNLLATALPQIESSPGGVLGRDLGRMIHSGDPRWATSPSAEQLAQAKPQDLILLLEPALAGRIDVTMVGDLTVDQAIAAVAPTLGALPQRAPWTAPSGAGVAFPPPSPSPATLLHSGRADQAIAFAAWPTRDFHQSPRDARALLVAAAAIRQRLFDSIRETDGSTYSPEVNAAASTALTGYGFLGASVEMPPAKIPGFFKALDAVMADLRAKPLSADELDRAKRPLIEARTRDRQLNGYWAAALPAALRDPRELDAIRSRVTGVEEITAADIQRVANSYLRGERAYRVIVTPRAAEAEAAAVAAEVKK